MSDEKIIVGISQGDINGIGLEVIIKTFLDPQMLEICTPVVFSSLKTASFHRKALNIEDFSFNQIKDFSEATIFLKRIKYLPKKDTHLLTGNCRCNPAAYYSVLKSPLVGDTY